MLLMFSAGIHNAEILFRADCTIDEFIDVVEGNRVYLRALYVYNKIDTVTLEEVNEIAHQPDSVVIRCVRIGLQCVSSPYCGHLVVRSGR